MAPTTGQPGTDWQRLRSMTDEEVHAAVLSDPEINPTDEAFWDSARVVMPQAYMVDTNVFDRVLGGDIPLSSLQGCRLIITGIQQDELSKAKEPRRSALLATFEEIRPEVVPSSSFAFDIEGAGSVQAYWNDGTGNIEKMRARLQQLDRKNKRFLNQERDILIAETAIKNDAILVSDDVNLRQVISEFGGSAISSAQFACMRPR